MKIRIFLLTFSLLLIGSSFSFAQDIKRPKIGLALSGGGAKGMAHIGVLKVLEEVGIIPDYVTGTSMGSIIGGLYSVGYSPAELEKIALEADWDLLLSNQIPFNQVAYEEKNYYGRYVFDLPVKNFSPSLPSGLIEGQNLGEFISHLTRSSHGIDDFDKLPIPFRCVATDISAGEKVVLGKGSLSEALRASMAIPSVFTTVNIDGKLLVDGGLVRNFPVQEAFDMGADYVIGVFVSSDLKGAEELDNMVEILNQATFIMSALDSREQIKLCNLYLEPDMTDYGTFSFSSGREIIDQGEKVARQNISQLEQLLKEFKSKGYQSKKPKKIVPLEKYLIHEVKVVGNDEIPADLIKAKLRVKENDSLDINTIAKRINEVYGTGYFQGIIYEILPRDSAYDLLIKVKESERVKFKLAVHYNNEIRAGINANLTMRNILLKSSRLLFEVDIAENPRINLNYLKYLGKKQNSAATLGSRVELYEVPLFSANKKIATLNNNLFSPYLNLQTTLHPNRSLGIIGGADFSRLTPKVSDILNFVDQINFESFYAGAFYGINSLNKPFFPTRGSKMDIRYRNIFINDSRITTNPIDSIDDATLNDEISVEPFQSFRFDYLGYLPINDWFNINFSFTSLFSTTQNPGINNSIGIGGFYHNYPRTQKFWGAELFEYITPYYSMAAMELRIKPVSNIYISGRLNYLDSKYPAQWIAPDNPDVTFGSSTYLLGWGFEAAYMSPFGPMSLNIGKTSEATGWRTGINLGFWIF